MSLAPTPLSLCFRNGTFLTQVKFDFSVPRRVPLKPLLTRNGVNQRSDHLGTCLANGDTN